MSSNNDDFVDEEAPTQRVVKLEDWGWDDDDEPVTAVETPEAIKRKQSGSQWPAAK